MEYDLLTEKIDITEPCHLNQKQCYWVDQIINNPVYEIETRHFRGRAMKMGVKLKLSNHKYGRSFNSLPDINNEIKKIWIKELTSFGISWLHTRGVIPYKILKKGNFIYPFVAYPKTGRIFVAYNVKKNRNVYFWVSKFNHENTRKFKSKRMTSGGLKYDPKMLFFRINGKEPDYFGNLKSRLFKILPKFKEMKHYENLLKMQENRKFNFPMILEAELPKTQDQINMIKEINKIRIQTSAEEDMRQKSVDPDTEMRDDVHSMEISTSHTFKNTGNKFLTELDYTFSKEEPYWPRQRGMQFKLLPGQKFRDYRIQELQVKVDMMQEEFERFLSAILGSVFKPWSRDPYKSTSDAFLVQSQLFVSTAANEELEGYENFFKELYWRIYGHSHLELLVLNRKIKGNKFLGNRLMPIYRRNGNINTNRVASSRFSFDKNRIPNSQPQNRPQFRQQQHQPRNNYNFNRNLDRYKLNQPIRQPQQKQRRQRPPPPSMKNRNPLNDDEVENLNLLYDLEIKFIVRPFIVRPGFERLDAFYYAGAIEPSHYKDIMSDIFNVPLKEISQEQLFEGVQKQGGNWINERVMKKNIDMQANPEKYMMMQQQMRGMGGGGGGGRPGMSQQRPSMGMGMGRQQKRGGGGGGGGGGQQEKLRIRPRNIPGN